MKLPFLLLPWLISFSLNVQSIEARLKANVLKLETDQATKAGRKLTDPQFVSFQYSLIPIKEWWHLHYSTFIEFRTQMRLVSDQTYSQLREQDKRKGTHQADSLAAKVRQEVLSQVTDSSPEEAHFKAKYEQADSAQQVYQVWYELSHKPAGQTIVNRKLRKAFYPSDLSEVKSFD